MCRARPPEGQKIQARYAGLFRSWLGEGFIDPDEFLANVIPAQREKFFWPKAKLDEHPNNEVVTTDQHREKRSTFIQAQIAF